MLNFRCYCLIWKRAWKKICGSWTMHEWMRSCSEWLILLVFSQNSLNHWLAHTYWLSNGPHSISILVFPHNFICLKWGVSPLPSKFHPSCFCNSSSFGGSGLDLIEFLRCCVSQDWNDQHRDLLWHCSGVQTSIQGLDVDPPRSRRSDTWLTMPTNDLDRRESSDSTRMSPSSMRSKHSWSSGLLLQSLVPVILSP